MKAKSFNKVRSRLDDRRLAIATFGTFAATILVLPQVWDTIAETWNALATILPSRNGLPKIPTTSVEGLGPIQAYFTLIYATDFLYLTVCEAIMAGAVLWALVTGLLDYERFYDGTWAGPEPAPGKGLLGDARLLSDPVVLRKDMSAWTSEKAPEGGTLVVGAMDPREYRLYDSVHFCVLGRSGDGKSRRVIAPTIVANVLAGRTVVVNDIKGELGDWICPWAEGLGTHRVVRLRLDDPEASEVRYDPLARARKKLEAERVGAAVAELRELAACVISGSSSGPDAFFVEGGRRMLAGLCLHVLTSPEIPDDCRNLSTVAALIEASGNSDQMTRLAALQRSIPADSPARPMVCGVSGERGGGPGVLAEVTRGLSKFVDAQIDVITHDDELALADLGTTPTLLFVSSTAATGDRSSLVATLFSQVISSLRDCAWRSGGRLPVPAVLVMDEFASIGRLERLPRDIGEIRSEGITLIACWQTLHQLQSVCGYSREESLNLLGQLHSKLVLSCGDAEIAEDLSKTIGNYTIISRNASETSYANQGGGSTGYTETRVARRVITQDEMMVWSAKEYGHLLVTPNGTYALPSKDVSGTFVSELLGMGADGSGQELRAKAFKQRTVRNTEHAHIWRMPEKDEGKAKADRVPDGALADYPVPDDSGVVAPPADYMPDGFYE